uniref:F-box domain-containing protein n=1 Tax=Hordeum vulgare subsp. vulgare TaxID=112509 RepID=A0A8I6Y2D3_HORVV
MPPPLRDALLEEVFFRLPPDEPEHLLCASLVSMVWLALLSDPRFHARYRDFHGAPPMLGFHCSWRSISEDNHPYFFPTTKFRARIPDDDWENFRYAAWDCHHGRVLLADEAMTASTPIPLSFGTP